MLDRRTRNIVDMQFQGPVIGIKSGTRRAAPAIFRVRQPLLHRTGDPALVVTQTAESAMREVGRASEDGFGAVRNRASRIRRRSCGSAHAGHAGPATDTGIMIRRGRHPERAAAGNRCRQRFIDAGTGGSGPASARSTKGQAYANDVVPAARVGTGPSRLIQEGRGATGPKTVRGRPRGDADPASGRCWSEYVKAPGGPPASGLYLDTMQQDLPPATTKVLVDTRVVQPRCCYLPARQSCCSRAGEGGRATGPRSGGLPAPAGGAAGQGQRHGLAAGREAAGRTAIGKSR